MYKPFLFSGLILLFTGCSVVTGIFKVGFWAGVILVGLIILFLLFFVNKFRRK